MVLGVFWNCAKADDVSQLGLAFVRRRAEVYYCMI